MTLTDKFRNKLEKKVFANGKLASDCTIYSVSSTSYDEYGGAYNKIESSASVRIVPYNYFTGNLNHLPFGDLEDGEMDAVVPYDTTVAIKDKVTFKSKDYEVKRKEDYIVENNIVGIALRLTENLA